MKTEEKIVEINHRLDLINDRVCEIKGELGTLDFQMELNKVDARLYRMKRKTLMYELELLDKKVESLNNDLVVYQLFKELAIESEERLDEEERVAK
jgi:hypothetical protein